MKRSGDINLTCFKGSCFRPYWTFIENDIFKWLDGHIKVLKFPDFVYEKKSAWS
jgi:hypothetical protein